MAEVVDWPARAVMARLIFSGAESNPRGKFADLLEWWDERLRTRTPSDWRTVLRRCTTATFPNTNVAKALKKMGVEPTRDNYLELVNASRQALNPRARRIKL